MCFEEREAKLFALRGRALRRGTRGQLVQAFRSRDGGHFAVRQRAAIHARIADEAVKAVRLAAAGADAQRLFRGEGLVQLVEQHACFLRLAVHKNFHARCKTRAVVNHGDVLPAVRRERGFSLDAQRIVEPALGEVDRDAPAFEMHAVAFGIGRETGVGILFDHA